MIAAAIFVVALVPFAGRARPPVMSVDYLTCTSVTAPKVALMPACEADERGAG